MTVKYGRQEITDHIVLEKERHLPVDVHANGCTDSNQHLLHFFIYGKQMRTLPPNGRIYQQTIIDTDITVRFAKLYDRKHAITVADALKDKVVLFFEEQQYRCTYANMLFCIFT